MTTGEAQLPKLPAGYEYVKRLAVGGQGAVWLVLNNNMGSPGRYEAAKILLDDAPSQGVNLQRFYQEISTLATLSHPNIVTIYYANPKESYFIMEYLAGGSLAQLMKEKKLSESECFSILKQVIDGLSVAHSKKLIHRDLKPQNILFSSTGIPKITDFGLAKQQQLDGPHLTVTQSFVGTPYYMSPEQWLDSTKIDHRADIWALGVILYEMLAGRHPFYGIKGMGLMYATISTPIELPSKFRQLTDLGKTVEPICMRALEKDLGKRYQHVEEMGIDLSMAINVEPQHQSQILAPILQDDIALKEDMGEGVTYVDNSPLPGVQKVDLMETMDRGTLAPVSASPSAVSPSQKDTRTPAGRGQQPPVAPQARAQAATPKPQTGAIPKASPPRPSVDRPQPIAAQRQETSVAPGAKRPPAVPPKSTVPTTPETGKGQVKPQRQTAAAPERREIPDYVKKILQWKREIALSVGLLTLAVVLYVVLKTPSVSKLEKRMRESEETAQLEALELLKKYGDSEALPALMAALDSKYSRVRKNAVHRISSMGRSGVSGVLETLEEAFPECGEDGKIAILDAMARLGDRNSTPWLREIIHAEKSTPLCHSAIQCLISIDPSCESDYSEYQGQWYGNWYLEDEGYVRIEKQWHDPAAYLDKAKPAQIDARNFFQNLQREREKYTRALSHPEEIDLSDFGRGLARYREVVEKTVPLLPHLGKSRVNDLLSQFHGETAQGVIALFNELATLGEDLKRSGPISTYIVYEKIDKWWAQTLGWPWIESSKHSLREIRQRHRHSMQTLANAIPKTLVVCPAETEQEIQSAIRYAWSGTGRLPHFVGEAKEYYDLLYLFSFPGNLRGWSPGTPPASLIEAFGTNGRTLAADAALETAGAGYVIRDQITYLALSHDDSVEIYERRLSQKWCVVEYGRNGPKLGCRFSFWYAPSQGEKTRVWEHQIHSDAPSTPDAGETAAQASLLKNLRQWQPPWQQIDEQCRPQDLAPEPTDSDQKVRGSTWETAQDTVYLTNGQQLRGLIKEETDDYLVIVYSFRPSKGSMQVATQKILKSKIKTVERIDGKTRKAGLKELEDIKKNQLEETKEIQSVRLQHIQWPFSDSTGWEYRGDRFVLMSNAPADFVREVAYSVNEIFKAYESFFKVVRNHNQKVTIYIFNSMQEYYGATGGQILNPAFYMPAKNLIAAGCDLESYAAKVAEIRSYHEKLRQEIETQRKKVEDHKKKIRAAKQEQMAQLDNALRTGQMSRTQYDNALRNLRKQEEEIQEQISKYRKQLSDMEDEMRTLDYRNKKIVEEYSGQMLTTLYHEAFHAFLDNFLFEQGSMVPLWLNEGMAQFFENSFTEGGQFYIGKMDARRVKLLKGYIHEGKTVSLTRFFVADSESFLVRDQSNLENSSIHYLQSWAIVYYLAQQYDLRKGNFFNQYVKDLKAGMAPPEAFHRLVEMPLDKFDEQWQQALLKWK